MPIEIEFEPETPMDFGTYKAWLIAQDPLISSVHDDGRGHAVAIKRLMFHWTMTIAEIGDTLGYFDRWCYQTAELAEIAVIEWKARGYAGEPIGWHKHPMSERRREALSVEEILKAVATVGADPGSFGTRTANA